MWAWVPHFVSHRHMGSLSKSLQGVTKRPTTSSSAPPKMPAGVVSECQAVPTAHSSGQRARLAQHSLPFCFRITLSPSQVSCEDWLLNKIWLTSELPLPRWMGWSLAVSGEPGWCSAAAAAATDDAGRSPALLLHMASLLASVCWPLAMEGSSELWRHKYL